jgi:hypothetical protein
MCRHHKTFETNGIVVQKKGEGKEREETDTLLALSAISRNAEESTAAISRNEIRMNHLLEEAKAQYVAVAQELKSREVELGGRSSEVSEKSRALQELLENVDSTKVTHAEEHYEKLIHTTFSRTRTRRTLHTCA